MARGGARPGAGRKAGKSANTSPLSRARVPAREAAGNQRPWPADKVERWAIDRLIPYAKNARTHTDASLLQLFTRRTGALLRHQKKRGILRSVKDPQHGRFDLWEIAV